MPRRKTDSTASTSPEIIEEKTAANPPEVEASKSDNLSEEVDSTSGESEVQLQPAEFAREGRQMVCTVCGTEARLNLDRELFCPNAHNHPLLTTEIANS